MRVEVEIEDGVIPPGKELVRIGWPKKGEQHLSARNLMGVYEATYDWGGDHPNVIIVRDVWQWPEWLKAGWIWMTDRGEWMASDQEPVTFDEGWPGGWSADYRITCCLKWFAFTPPPCTDWKQSLRRNPNFKAVKS